MYALGDFQSIFQLSAALHLIAEWAEVAQIEAHYQEKVRREIGLRLRRFGKYIKEFEDDDFSDENITTHFELKSRLTMQKEARFLRLLIRVGAVYSVVMLLLSSFFAEAEVTGAPIIILVGLIFVPALYFFLTIVRRIKKDYASYQAELESIIEPAEQANREYNDRHAGPAFQRSIKAVRRGDREAVIRHRKERQKIERDRKSFVEKRVAELTEQNATNEGDSV